MPATPSWLSLTRAARGFTLVEIGVVVAIAATLIAVAAPSFKNMINRRHLEGRASELAIDLQLLRSEVVARNQSMRISFRSTPSGSCYVIHAGAAGACNCMTVGAPVCSGGEQVAKSVFMPAASPVRITANVRSMNFVPPNGTVTPTGKIFITDAEGRTIRHKVNILGRIQTCVEGSMPGYKSC